jgi:hypothetical protein
LCPVLADIGMAVERVDPGNNAPDAALLETQARAGMEAEARRDSNERQESVHPHVCNYFYS